MQESSYGMIPLYKGENGLEIFVIHQYGSAGNMLWTFPKGKQEKGEVPIETALREVEEETGIEINTYQESESYSISYSFERNGEQIEKTTTYFVGFAKSKEFKVQEQEIKEGEWLSVRKARERLTYDGYKKLLDDALANLDK